VLGVCGGAVEHAAEDLGGPLVGELQERDRLRVALAPDLVRDEARLAGCNAHVLGDSFHLRLAVRSLFT
jgi:hypothetical protein